MVLPIMAEQYPYVYAVRERRNHGCAEDELTKDPNATAIVTSRLYGLVLERRFLTPLGTMVTLDDPFSDVVMPFVRGEPSC